MDLQAQVRAVTGRSATKEWRKKGFVVGEVYGHGFANVHVAVPAKDFIKAYKAAGETTVVTLTAAGAPIPVLIQDVVRDAFSGVVEHADFRHIRMDEKLTASVPIEFIGVSPAIAAGAVLIKAIAELEVEALPADIPHTLVVDLSLLTEIGQSIYVKDLPVNHKKAVIKADVEAVVATVAAPRAEEVIEKPVMTMDDIKAETDEERVAREKAKAEKTEDSVK